MSTLEEKILDGPRVHYCEDGDDDIRTEELENGDSLNEDKPCRVESLFNRVDSNDGISSSCRATSCNYSRNTGPKGVIEDYKKKSEDDELETEFQALMNDDSFLKEYLPKRLQESTPTFGFVYRLQSGQELLDAIDKESPNVLVVVHIYTKFSKACSMLNKCLDALAEELKKLKFVTLDAGVTGLSQNFKDNGVPALLVYKSGQLVKSIVQLDEFLDKTFDATDVKNILRDSGLI